MNSIHSLTKLLNRLIPLNAKMPSIIRSTVTIHKLMISNYAEIGSGLILQYITNLFTNKFMKISRSYVKCLKSKNEHVEEAIICHLEISYRYKEIKNPD